MVVANPSPLVDRLPSKSASTEDMQISLLLCEAPALRLPAAEWLKQKGNSETAYKLEHLLIKNGLPSEVKKSVREVLVHLSHEHLGFCTTREGEFRRKLALASPFPAYTRRARS